ISAESNSNQNHSFTPDLFHIIILSHFVKGKFTLLLVSPVGWVLTFFNGIHNGLTIWLFLPLVFLNPSNLCKKGYPSRPFIANCSTHSIDGSLEYIRDFRLQPIYFSLRDPISVLKMFVHSFVLLFSSLNYINYVGGNKNQNATTSMLGKSDSQLSSIVTNVVLASGNVHMFILDELPGKNNGHQFDS
ncbi:hypothetical protein BLOT_013926, partial [Blomia tropicalis]